MKTDAQIKEDVLAELLWQPNIDETKIGVIVEDGVVTLSGIINSYTKKLEAEKAAKNVKGVKAVALDIEVKHGSDFKKTDKEIAKAVVNALTWNTSIPEDKIAIKVEDGWIYLSGELKWSYQKDAAKKAVQNLLGVKGVVNSIQIKQAVQPSQIKEKITKAFERSAQVDADNVSVLVDGHTVTLRGTVHSVAEKDEAQKAAFLAPGVYSVKNELKVQYYPEYA
ncbi:BON domain-containing protein [uncultured Lutibacter sp.]|uniref:BON domain-containing protein n=1 Tax=uncultured Lutibacter sp. TaxID=437739 RepID=UPI00262C6724|nr:BON domain-containing protein [uncultured Lutibacter sp.]